MVLFAQDRLGLGNLGYGLLWSGVAAGTLTVDGIVGPKTWTKLLSMWLSGDEPG
jgi:peptidoglycan hydrolase-like protein with peptidoglycan-binding domain